MPQNTDSYRLPRTVVPSRYDLRLEPDLDAANFSGSISIHVEVTQQVDEILLNAAELEIKSAVIEDSYGNRTPITDISLDEKTERARFTLAAAVQPGIYQLRVAFTGILNDKLRGFYRSIFKDEDGTDRVIATTQFESTDARRAFPCFDEPDFKAVFAVTLIAPEDQFAVSNGPIVEELLLGEGQRKIVFGDTIKMSTYLVAFIVGPFEATEPVKVDGVPLRIVHPIGKRHLAGYALEVGAFALRYFSEYYGIPYPDRKLDMVAVPDFASGAMENLGCITYREVLLLVDKKRATQPELIRIADVIAHEIAHMWFGGLVTMRWWNGLWLNEAFATFMATAATAAFNRDWHRWAQFSLERSAAFDVDSLEKTRPIEYPVNSPADAAGMFALLTYEKGGSVLRMLEQYLGEERFRDGIRYYLNKYKYANTETGDLWDAIEKVTGEPSRRIMDSWIFQQGFPVISVSTSGDGSKLVLSQRRFRYTPVESGKVPLWSVPIMLRFSAGGKTSELRQLLEETVIEVDMGAPADWVVVNTGGNGFYRVEYIPALLQKLTLRMMEILEPIDRYGLVDDTWASVLSGGTSAVDFLEFAKGFGNEEDLDVWTVLSGCLNRLDRLLTGEAGKRYQRLLRKIYKPVFDRVSWHPGKEDSPRMLELRGLLIKMLASTAKDLDAIFRSRKLHDAYLEDSSSVDPNVAAAVAAAVASDGTSDDYEIFFNRFKNADTPQEERRYQSLLAGFPGISEMDRTLDMTLNGEVRTQDAPYLVANCMMNRDHGQRAWEFVRDRWEDMLEIYPDNAIVWMLGGVKSLSTRETADEIKAFFKVHKVPQGELTLEQHLEKLWVNVGLREREAELLTAALLE